jgi:ribosomal protein S18 acetylase RimI-like enzyme
MTMDRIRIERLKTDAGERLRTIRLRALQEAPYAFEATYEESAARPPESWARQLADLATFVAVDGGHDVGMVRAGPHGVLADAAYLISMWVAPEARRRGVGNALIDAIVHWAKATGYARVVLDVGTHNPHAIALYVRAGFVAMDAPRALPSPREHLREQQMARALARSVSGKPQL